MPATTLTCAERLPLLHAGFENKRALVVDDSPVNRKIALIHLKELGYSVRLACNAFEALQVAVSDHFHLIIMDVVLPGMSGLECTRVLRSRQTSALRPCIVGWSTTATPEECHGAGMDGVLPKPLSRGSLKDCLRRLALHD